MNFSIRQAAISEIATLASQRRKMFSDMGTKDTALLDRIEHDFQLWVAPRMTDGTYYAWLALDQNETIIGGAALWLMAWPPSILSMAQWRGNIFNVYTDPAFRNQGIARKLTSNILEWCGERGIDCVILHASKQGRPLYESLGFAATNEMRILLRTQSPGSNS